MAGQLSDDGTMDTVIRCSECGREQRYNYDPTGQDESEVEAMIEANMRDLKLSRSSAEDSVNEYLYGAFIDWCIEDFEESHECEKGADDATN